MVVVYLDDILIYTHSDNLEDHWKVVRRVMDRLQEAELYTNLSKCSFATTEVGFLGFIINREGVKADPARISTIRK